MAAKFINNDMRKFSKSKQNIERCLIKADQHQKNPFTVQEKNLTSLLNETIKMIDSNNEILHKEGDF